MNEKHEAHSYHVTFNAMHNPVLDDPGKMHAHTFRVGMYVIVKKVDDTEQTEIFNSEKILDEYFSKYRGIRINELPVFRDVVPTLENMGMVFYEELGEIFERYGRQLLFLEIGDSPISTYCIGERLLLGSIYNLIDESAIDGYCQRVREFYEELEKRKAVGITEEDILEGGWLEDERMDNWVDGAVGDMDIFPYDF